MATWLNRQTPTANANIRSHFILVYFISESEDFINPFRKICFYLEVSEQSAKIFTDIV